ncbi:NAD(P)/FAD-dependent oxidoreductase [Flaviflexus huanghaiensis]|uniref:NAD(P)/FAD-dependent oxidoreductase n=1 Tax=Flaviflexus huanghaiensis TaxID=1111473 RepID=UPI0015FD8506|nr:FAD-dependent oxidoreductase [Flaviflexus huanghaiensis]
MKTLTPTVLIVGAGPAGLAAAAGLARTVDVLVVERESEAGGIPRHSKHLGYGMRDMTRFMSGPAYAAILLEKAKQAGAEIMTHTQVTEFQADGTLVVTSPQGRFAIAPSVTILATGARERPRMARRIPGDRPSGVLTTGQLQNMVHLHGEKLHGRAVIVGGELVSWSAALTLREAGAKPVALISHYPKSESYRIFRGPGRFLFGTRVVTNSAVTRVIGKRTVSGVEIENSRTGERSVIDADIVVFTGDWVPDHELARMAGLDMDPVAKSPMVDSGLRTSKPGVFAIGNLLHPVDTADVAALDGEHVVDQVLAYLGGITEHPAGVGLTVDAPLRWVSPNIIRPRDVRPARGKLLFWTDKYVPLPVVEVRQAGRLIGSIRMIWPAAPGRVFRVPASILNRVDYSAGPVTISIRNA